MKRAFSIVEILIVVAVLGILAAIVLPELRSHSLKAKEAASKENLHILRNAIKLYVAQHNGVPPGYIGDDPSLAAIDALLPIKIVNQQYVGAMPTNPFNELTTVNAIQDVEEFPAQPTGEYGWIYKPKTKTIKIDWPGTDSSRVPYFNY